MTAILQSAGSPVSLKKTKGDLSVSQNIPRETTCTSTDRNRNVRQKGEKIQNEALAELPRSVTLQKKC